MPSPHAEPPPERVEEIFQEAAGLAAGDRAAYLDEACAGDELLRAMVEELLVSADAASDHPVWSGTALLQEAKAVALDAVPTLDRYRVTGRLGAGGMGVVYRAERSDGAYRKEVAIK